MEKREMYILTGKACPNREVHAIATFGDTRTVGNLCPNMEGLKTFLFSMETHGMSWKDAQEIFIWTSNLCKLPLYRNSGPWNIHIWV